MRKSYQGRDGFQRVNRETPCPVCKKSDWCMVAPDGSAAICARVDQGAEKRIGAAGWLHRLRERDDGRERHRHGVTRALADFARRSGNRRAGPAPRPERGAPDGTDLGAMARRCAESVGAKALERFACELAVNADSLRRLGVGWSAERGAWTFPMRDPAGRIVGVRLRFGNGEKLSVKGGHEALFIPSGIPGPAAPWPDGARLYITEGPTDCAALLTLGFRAIGRPSCTGGVRYAVELSRGRPTVIVADADPPGQRGAKALADVLRTHCPDVRIIFPPSGAKDIREAVKRGATSADVEHAVEQATPIPRWSARALASVRGGVA